MTRLHWNRTSNSCDLVEKMIRAYHLYGKPGVSGKNSNETLHPVGIFRVKRYYLPRYMFHLFHRFYRKDQNCLYHLCELPVPPGFPSRLNPRNLPVFCKWYNSIPFMFSMRKKIIIIIIIIMIKIPVLFVGKFWSIFRFTSYFLLLHTERSLPRSPFCLVT